jgi:hypothetical protein
LPKEKQDSLDRQKESMSAIQDCYWIIRKSDSRIWGPMTASDFKTMCLRLKIKAKLSKKKEKKRLL